MSTNTPSVEVHKFETIDRCRICQNQKVDLILDLGDQPPANCLYKQNENPPSRVPLRIGRCASCSTIQLLETVNPEQLFSKYVWLTQTAKTAVNYAEVFADRLEKITTGKICSILEVGSNDGTFLKVLQRRGHKVLGVDPAVNIGEVARESGVPTVSDFFSVNLARDLVKNHQKFDVVIARNVLPHVSDLHSVIAGIKESLAVDGIAIFEFHRADMILEELHYDSIYHEHLYLHSLKSIENIANRYGLLAFDVDESPISGGSFVAYFSLSILTESSSLKAAREHESILQIGTLDAWQRFAENATDHILKFRNMVVDAISENKRIIGFGASARSSTLLNAAQLCGDHILAIADNNAWKQGLMTPGSAIKIVSVEEALSLRPDVVVLLAWNFKSELLAQLKNAGFSGEVIIPLPGSPHIERI